MNKRLLIPLALLLALPGPGALGNGCPTPCSGPNASPPSAKYLYVQRGGPNGIVAVYDTATARPAFVLPAGASSADGRWHASASPRGVDGTQITRFLLRNGRMTAAWFVPGYWRMASLSPNGRWAALVDPIAAAPTRLAVVDMQTRRFVQRVVLPGRFEVETVSADGRRMFLIEHLAGAEYLVRVFDVRRNKLKTQALKASGEGAPMVGEAWSGIASPGGTWLLTLYLNTRHNHAFIHALDLVRSKPTCIGLPSGDRRLGSLKRYTLTLAPSGHTLFAANPALGVVAEIDLRTTKVVRVARFKPSSAGASTQRLLAGTISRSGRTLYFSAGRDLWAYDAAAHVVRGPYRTDGRIVGLGYGAGDRTIHALRANGSMLTLEAATGKRIAST